MPAANRLGAAKRSIARYMRRGAGGSGVGGSGVGAAAVAAQACTKYATSRRDVWLHDPDAVDLRAVIADAVQRLRRDLAPVPHTN